MLRAYLETDKQLKDHDASLLAKGKFVYDEEACRRHRCVDSVNGGFLFYRNGLVSSALAAWAGSCASIIRGRENQPALVNALKGTLTRDGCLYDDDSRNTTTTTWPAPLTSQLVVLNQDLFVSGRRAAFAREALHRNELLAFHANFLYGWRAKCEKLRKLGLLFVDVAGGDVCRDPAAVTCRS